MEMVLLLILLQLILRLPLLARNIAGPRQSNNQGGQHDYSSKPELMNFLGIMKELMPIGGDKWDKVLDCHSLCHPG